MEIIEHIKRSRLAHFIKGDTQADGRYPDMFAEHVFSFQLLNFFCLVAVLVLPFFAVRNLSLEYGITRFVMDILSMFACLAAFLLLRTKAPFALCGLLFLGSLTTIFLVHVWLFNMGDLLDLWFYVFPFLSFFILGTKWGAMLSGLFLAISAPIVLVPGISRAARHGSDPLQLISVYVLVFILTLLHESALDKKNTRVKKLTDELEAEHNRLLTIQDNLAAGVFLMDKDLVIQNNYSYALSAIFGVKSLRGKKLPDILSASLKPKKLAVLRDFFELSLARKFDRETMADLNPISTFEYTNAAAGEVKTLRCFFSLTRQRSSETYILGTINDITVETRLQKELRKKEAERDNEMQLLFEVLRVEPSMLTDFMQDIVYQTNRLHEMQNAKMPPANEVLALYQATHAIKSNALILGLEQFGNKAHTFEDTIKNVREKEEITAADVQTLKAGFQELLDEREKLNTALSQIRAYNFAGWQKDYDNVILESLRLATENCAEEAGKQVRFSTDNVDHEALLLLGEHHHLIKECLLQLIKNAIYHGIGLPHVRKGLGLSEYATIEFSIKKTGKNIQIMLRDDGRGLDLEGIRGRAIECGLLKPEDTGDPSKIYAMIFEAGFSTSKNVNLHAGRGIGLNLVRDRINEIHGVVDVETEQGVGTTFTLTLPLEKNGIKGKSSKENAA